MSELNVLALSGSLRAESYNTALLHAAREVAPEGVTVELHHALGALPLYDQDLDDTGPAQPAVLDWRRRITEADALLIATPEHNASIPAALKNAIDWASRGSGAVLADKPVAIAGASPGALGSARAQLALRQVLNSIGSDLVVKPEVTVFRCHQRLDESGAVADEGTRALLAELLTALAGKVRGRRVLAPAAA